MHRYVILSFMYLFINITLIHTRLDNLKDMEVVICYCYFKVKNLQTKQFTSNVARLHTTT
jgi:hypothetical protein